MAWVPAAGPRRITGAKEPWEESGPVVSEQGFSDAAQEKVAGSAVMRGMKAVINAGLRLTGAGSSIEAIYERPK